MHRQRLLQSGTSAQLMWSGTLRHSEGAEVSYVVVSGCTMATIPPSTFCWWWHRWCMPQCGCQKRRSPKVDVQRDFYPLALNREIPSFRTAHRRSWGLLSLLSILQFLPYTSNISIYIWPLQYGFIPRGLLNYCILAIGQFMFHISFSALYKFVPRHSLIYLYIGKS
jgi:hypothetical protein